MTSQWLDWKLHWKDEGMRRPLFSNRQRATARLQAVAHYVLMPTLLHVSCTAKTPTAV
jgi:hypothetical protein